MVQSRTTKGSPAAAFSTSWSGRASRTTKGSPVEALSKAGNPKARQPHPEHSPKTKHRHRRTPPRGRRWPPGCRTGSEHKRAAGAVAGAPRPDGRVGAYPHPPPPSRSPPPRRRLTPAAMPRGGGGRTGKGGEGRSSPNRDWMMGRGRHAGRACRAGGPTVVPCGAGGRQPAGEEGRPPPDRQWEEGGGRHSSA